jgi:hypothetical protein
MRTPNATHYIYINRRNELHPDFHLTVAFKPKILRGFGDAIQHLPDGYSLVTGTPSQLLEDYGFKLIYYGDTDKIKDGE